MLSTGFAIASAAPAALSQQRDRRPSPARRRKTYPPACSNAPARASRRHSAPMPERPRSPAALSTSGQQRAARPARQPRRRSIGRHAVKALGDVLDPLEQDGERLEIRRLSRLGERLNPQRAFCGRLHHGRHAPLVLRPRETRGCSSRCVSRSFRNSIAVFPARLVASRRSPNFRVGLVQSSPRDRRRSRDGSWEIRQDLDHALRRAPQPVRIPGSGRLLARGEQTDDRVQLVGKRHGRPCDGRLARAARESAARRPPRRPAGSGSTSPSTLPRARPSCRA